MKRWHYMVVIVFMACITRGTALAASPGAWLNWKAPYGPSADPITLPCASQDSVVQFVVTFVPAEDVSDFVAVDLSIYFNTQPREVSPFWRLDAGGCNEIGLGITNEPPPDLGNIVNPWGVASGGVATVARLRSPSLEEVRGVAYRPTPFNLRAGVMYYAGTITLAMCAAATCAGCGDNLTAYVNYVVPQSGAGTPTTPLTGYDYLCVNPVPDYSCVYPFGPLVTSVADPGEMAGLLQRLQFGPRARPQSVCEPVPVRAQSWGMLKLLYR